MTKTEELLALADALEQIINGKYQTPVAKFIADTNKAAAALREYAATLGQEPVAWIGPYKSAWDALNELRKSCAEIIGADPETWPNHGNAPLAIAATLAIARTHMEQGTHPPAPTTQKVCHGIPRIGCNYLAECDSICNKCGQLHAVQFIPPAPTTPLTDEQIDAIPIAFSLELDGDSDIGPALRKFARAVLAAQEAKSV